jgi:hypothetical protein
MKTRILEAEQDPHLLEALYRLNPEEFTTVFPEVIAEKPDSAIFQIWKERLYYPENIEIESTEKVAENKSNKNLIFIVFFCILGGMLAKIPVFFKWEYHQEELFYMRNVSLFFMPFIILYFLIHRKAAGKKWILILLLLVISVVYINFLPNYIFPGKIGNLSDTLILACIHLPFFLWFTGGLAFLTPDFWNIPKRIEYLKLNGEIVMYTLMVLIFGAILTGITNALFSVAGINIFEWYLKWIVVFGSAASPIVATALVLNKGKKYINFAPLLSKIFAPLFMLTLLVFLVVICTKLQSPFLERDFLLVINLLLLVVVAITTFVIIDRPAKQKINLLDYNTIILLFSSLIIEVIALYSVIIRLKSYGFTPNRVILIGINLIILVQLSGIIFCYIKWLCKKAELALTIDWIAKYIPVFFYWSAFVVFVFPWLFGLR